MPRQDDVGVGSMRLLYLWHRFYSDFLMPSRLESYRSLLLAALNEGYEVRSVASFWEELKEGSFGLDRKYLILRHDVDTDVATAKAMWKIERDLGLRTSYYFRLSTADVPFMCEIAATGGEAGYHFEELATVAKERGLRHRSEILLEIPRARDLFLANLNQLREKTGLPMKIVASHGDFVNRASGVPNTVLLDDRDFRLVAGIELEVYDQAFMQHIASRHSDTMYPAFWQPVAPGDALNRGLSPVYILVHPRHWRANISANAKDDAERIVEFVQYWLRGRSRTSLASAFGKRPMQP